MFPPCPPPNSAACPHIKLDRAPTKVIKGQSSSCPRCHRCPTFRRREVDRLAGSRPAGLGRRGPSAVMASVSRVLWLALVSLALLQCVQGAVTAAQLVGEFQKITTLSSNLRIEAQGLNLVNSVFRGPRISQGFAGIVNSVTAASSLLEGPAVALGDADAQLVVNALTTFVQVHQVLLNVVIGKHGLLTLIPFFEPIRQSLVQLEATVDTFALLVIARIPTQTSAANTQFSSLRVTLTLAIDTYSQLV